MDWAKAKSILIFVFLALNIFLIVNLGLTNYGSNTSRDAILNTVKILNNKGITLTCAIPVYNSDTPKLSYENSGLDRAKIAAVILGDKTISVDSQKENIELVSGNKVLKYKGFNNLIYTNAKPTEKINISNRNEVEKCLKNFLNSLDIPASEYYTDEYKINSDGNISVVLRDKYKKLVFFDNCATFVVSKEGIISLDCTFRKIIKPTTKKYPIIAVYEILLKNFNINKNIIITGIDLGWYIGDKNEADIKGASAQTAWRIITKEGEKFYFNAYSGDRLD